MAASKWYFTGNKTVHAVAPQMCAPSMDLSSVMHEAIKLNDTLVKFSNENHHF